MMCEFGVRCTARSLLRSRLAEGEDAMTEPSNGDTPGPIAEAPPTVPVPPQATGAEPDRPGPPPKGASKPTHPKLERPMDSRPRILLGIWLFLLSGLSLAHLVWAWSFTSRLVPATTAAGTTASIPHIRVHWLGIGFAPTLDASLVLLVLLAPAAS
jgi:hypothetical protein